MTTTYGYSNPYPPQSQYNAYQPEYPAPYSQDGMRYTTRPARPEEVATHEGSRRGYSGGGQTSYPGSLYPAPQSAPYREDFGPVNYRTRLVHREDYSHTPSPYAPPYNPPYAPSFAAPYAGRQQRGYSEPAALYPATMGAWQPPYAEEPVLPTFHSKFTHPYSHSRAVPPIHNNLPYYEPHRYEPPPKPPTFSHIPVHHTPPPSQPVSVVAPPPPPPEIVIPRTRPPAPAYVPPPATGTLPQPQQSQFIAAPITRPARPPPLVVADPPPPPPMTYTPSVTYSVEEDSNLRPWLGVAVKWLDDLDTGGKDNVCVVHEVLAGSPAEMAGIRPSDQLEFWDRERLDSDAKWKSLVTKIYIGQAIDFGIHRNGVDLRVPVRIEGTTRARGTRRVVESSHMTHTGNA